MSEGHRNHDSPLGRIAVAALIIVSVGATVFFAEIVSDIYGRRDVTPPGCTQGGDCGPQGKLPDILSARAAEDIVDIGIVQIIFGAIGLALLGWTLAATRAAVTEANEATRVARDIGDAQVRPWVDAQVTSVSMSSSKVQFDLQAEILLTNLGKTPAVNVVTRGRIVTSRGAGISLYGEFFPLSAGTGRSISLLPGGKGEIAVHPRASVDNLAIYTVSVQGKQVAGPQFHPSLELVVEYQWGSPLRLGRTKKYFAITAVPPEGRRDERTSYPVSLGQIPVTKLAAFETGVAEVI